MFAWTIPSGRPFAQLSPSLAAIDRFENAAVSSIPRAVFPRAFARFPKRSVNRLGIGRIDLHICAAGVLVFVEHLLEMLPAIKRTKNATLLVRPVGMTRDRHKEAIRIAWIDGELGDLLPIAQTEMRPRFACID